MEAIRDEKREEYIREEERGYKRREMSMKSISATCGSRRNEHMERPGSCHIPALQQNTVLFIGVHKNRVGGVWVILWLEARWYTAPWVINYLN